ncbi:hypothetical protein EJ05DRAFT_478619 [Pseudovirgaria hyperparasitica]|uniref:NAD dependent epimerase/dehydratase n=1 Tax=Pseudovirgaria hyperparasitica TaxID=470096 RepID=A0A6A6W140_9PEZI|nr:uncharacterized protein EJ05DRAFT_478619 [Pseudovirgaria hyperparasitica]KAF2755650.1 hypothetical protein EJ05DRAFT_478619 [Pseudovirgaria hyperparasitica]
MGAPDADPTLTIPSITQPNPRSTPKPGLIIIHAGLYRTGTASMAAAYRILGLHAHHGLDDVPGNNWLGIEHAAEATFPHIATSPRPKYTRADWDKLFGAYDVVTDLASVFVPEMIAAYPEAKVVVVQREFDSWWESFASEVLSHFRRPEAWIVGVATWWLLGDRAIKCMSKLIPGFFGVAHSRDVDIDIARTKYDEYYRFVRERVPKENRLEYKMGDGWEPLCAFLGKDVPKGVAFPRINDRIEHAKGSNERLAEVMSDLWKVGGPVLVGILATGGYFVWKRLL